MAADRLTQLLNAASDITAILRRREHYRFHVAPGAAFYLDTTGAIITLYRSDAPTVEVDIQLQLPAAWKLATDQDEAGVYVVARRRAVVGAAVSLTPLTGEAVFTITVPHSTPLILRLQDCRLTLDHLSGTFNLPGANLPPALPAEIGSAGKGKRLPRGK